MDRSDGWVVSMDEWGDIWTDGRIGLGYSALTFHSSGDIYLSCLPWEPRMYRWTEGEEGIN
jgi:hypothetical protein